MRVEPELPQNLKYRRLKTAVGDAAMEYLVTLWAHCQQNQRGEFWSGADADYVEMLCNWPGQRGELYRALVECGKPGKVGFVIPEDGGVRLHEWEEMNSQMVGNWRRNPSGRGQTPTRPQRPPLRVAQRDPNATPTATPTLPDGVSGGVKNGHDLTLGQKASDLHEYDVEGGSNGIARDPNATPTATPTGSPTRPQRPPQRTVRPVSLTSLYDQAGLIIALLNDLTGSQFNPPLAELDQIVARLQETGGDLEGVQQMLRCQAALWKDDAKARRWLKPGTLFGPNFHDYYGQRDQPVTASPSSKKTAPTDRTELLETLSATREQLKKTPGDPGLTRRVRELELQTA